MQCIQNVDEGLTGWLPVNSQHDTPKLKVSKDLENMQVIPSPFTGLGNSYYLSSPPSGGTGEPVITTHWQSETAMS